MSNKRKLDKEQFTLVQHSGFGYGDKAGFEHGVEIRTLSTIAEVDLVKKFGGLVFDSYKEADDAETEQNYPGDYKGMYPQATGKFSTKTIDGLRIYVPVEHLVVP